MNKPDDCLHVMLERAAPKIQKRIIDEHNTLKPMFMCSDCGTMFYMLIRSEDVSPPKKSA